MKSYYVFFNNNYSDEYGEYYTLADTECLTLPNGRWRMNIVKFNTMKEVMRHLRSCGFESLEESDMALYKLSEGLLEYLNYAIFHDENVCFVKTYDGIDIAPWDPINNPREGFCC